MRNLLSVYIFIATFFSPLANAAIIQHGNLVSDDATNFILDQSNNRQYLRADVLKDLTYSQTLAQLASGQDFEGWNIATTSIANDFINSLFDGPNDCPDGDSDPFSTYCGKLSSVFSDGDFGNSHNGSWDKFWFLSDYAPNTAGDIFIDTAWGGNIYQNMRFGTISATDEYASGGLYSDQSTGWLIYKDANVPEPSILTLMGFGLAGLVFTRRRKAQA